MRFEVEWTDEAQAMLDNIRKYWRSGGEALSEAVDVTSQELRAIEEARDDIEQLLQGFPLFGRQYRNSRTFRVLPLGPLSVGYQVFEVQRLVLILVVSYDNRRN